MPANIGYPKGSNTKRSRKRLSNGGEGSSNATFTFIDDPAFRPEEKQFIFNNVLKTTNPITGETQQFGKLKEFFRDPKNKDQLKKHFRKTNPRVHSLKQNTDAFLNDVFESSKGEFKQVAARNPRRNLVPIGVVQEILKNHPGFETAFESANDSFISESLGFTPEINTFKPRTFASGGNMSNKDMSQGRKSRKQFGGDFGNPGLDPGGELGTGMNDVLSGNQQPNFLSQAGNFLSNNADLLTSVGSTVANVSAAGQLETEQTPVIARRRRTPFKSALNETVRANQAAYQSYLDSLNESGGNANLGRGLGIAGVTKANTAASIADAQAANQFNLAEDRLDAGVNIANVNTLNEVNAANLGRRNRRLIEQTNARGAGTQDFLNVLTNRQAGNQQSKEMVLAALQSGDTGVIERVAESLGMSVGDLINSLSDPNTTLNFN